MHDTAWQFVDAQATTTGLTWEALDLGGRNVTGPNIRELWPLATWHVVDVTAGPGVTIVADARSWNPPPARYHLVTCCEVLEHVSGWPLICETAFRALRPGGLFVVTAAGPRRDPHTADGEPMPALLTEHYEAVTPRQLEAALRRAGFVRIRVYNGDHDRDTYAVAWSPVGAIPAPWEVHGDG